jgi:micrococcal nuclease
MKHALLALLFTLTAFAGTVPTEATKDAPPTGYAYRAEVVRVKDGDTIEVNIDLGFNVWRHSETLRMLRVFAPETFRPKDDAEKQAGLKVKAYLIARLTAGKSLTIQTHKDGTDKYGRYLAEVWDDKGSVNQGLLDFMVANNITMNKREGANANAK